MAALAKKVASGPTTRAAAAKNAASESSTEAATGKKTASESAVKAATAKKTASESAVKAATAKKTASRSTTKARKPGPAREPAKDVQEDLQRSAFPIVGIGASAGGLEAFAQFFTNMPPDTGMAFVLVQHLDPHHASRMPDLLTRYTRMPVFQAGDQTKPEPNTVYIAPSNKTLALRKGKFSLLEQTEPPGIAHTVDVFLRTLAEEQQDRAICIILSGTGTDGTLGLRAVKAELGMAMAQAPDSAAYSGMPTSAIETGLVDYVLPPSQMPAKLIEYVRGSVGPPVTKRQEILEKSVDSLQRVFSLLRNRFGLDLGGYKPAPIQRRIERRMAVNQIDDIAQYVGFLGDHPEEAKTLYQSVLINVTSFFRDPEAFEALKGRARTLVQEAKEGSTLRAWVPGCSTGEEAYSVAIVLHEVCDEQQKDLQIHVFGTDVDDDAISLARRAFYPTSIASDVGRERLRRYFVRKDDGYQLKKEIRETIVFASQNVVKDPPFSKIDLLSCRNLLIYLKSDLQKKLMTAFHYALNPGGLLFLGNSESVGEFTDFFRTVDRKWRVYERRAIPVPDWARANLPLAVGVDLNRPVGQEETMAWKKSIPELAERLLYATYIPPAVVVDSNNQVIYFHGKTGRYLQPASGQPTWNIFEMAREGLATHLSAALRKASTENTEVSAEGVEVSTNGGIKLARFTVKPIPNAPERAFLIVFEEMPAPQEALPSKGTRKRKDAKDAQAYELERELKMTKQNLQVVIEELETSNEELKSANEEYQSTNEELQSVNEELETSREELQSLNEELLTTNQELHKKNEELTRVGDDMKNVLDSIKIATVFVDNDMRILRFTPEATRLFNLIATDVGRPVGHITSNLKEADLAEDIKRVQDKLAPVERDVETTDSQWYKMRILPYRTVENNIAGVVMTFNEVTPEKKLRQDLEGALEYAEGIRDTLPLPFLVLDKELRVVSANPAFYRTFETSPRQTVGELIYQLGSHQWDIPKLRELLEEVLPKNSTLEGFEVEHDFPAIGRRKMQLSARRLTGQHDSTERILLLMHDQGGPSPKKTRPS